MISDTLFESISTMSSSISPAYPLLIPLTCLPAARAARTTALMQAFIPGASPPLVSTPIVFTSFAILVYLHEFIKICSFAKNYNQSPMGYILIQNEVTINKKINQSLAIGLMYFYDYFYIFTSKLVF